MSINVKIPHSSFGNDKELTYSPDVSAARIVAEIYTWMLHASKNGNNCETNTIATSLHNYMASDPSESRWVYVILINYTWVSSIPINNILFNFNLLAGRGLS